MAVVLVRGLASIVTLALVRLREMPIIWSGGSTRWLLLGAAALDALGYITYNVGLDRSSLAITAPWPQRIRWGPLRWRGGCYVSGQAAFKWSV